MKMKDTQPTMELAKNNKIPLTRDTLDKIADEIQYPDSCQYYIYFLLKEEKTYGDVAFNTIKEVQQFIDVLKKNGYKSDEYEVVKHSDGPFHVDRLVTKSDRPPFELQVHGYAVISSWGERYYLSTDNYPFKDEKKQKQVNIKKQLEDLCTSIKNKRK